jgi:5'-nucleotidase
MAGRRLLILLTNDDGIASPGLHAAAQALHDLGELLVAAPLQQWSGASRCFSAAASGVIRRHTLSLNGREVAAFGVDGTPAQAVLHAVLELASRPPDLLVVGINFGENLGADVTISGTVGAALQGAAMGIPALAVSLQTPVEMHKNPSDEVDFTAAMHFTRFFARCLLAGDFPGDVDLLKVDVPDNATPTTPWRLTRVSRCTYYRAVPPVRSDLSQPGRLGYEARWDPRQVEPDSDIHALAVERVVSVSPMSLDLTSRADLRAVEARLREGDRWCQDDR